MGNPHEFEESLNNINKSVTSILALILCVLLPFVCLLGGCALLIVAATLKDSDGKTTILFLGIGGGVAALQKGRMRKAVAIESAKYSGRSPVPCAWRLDSTTVVRTGYKGKRSSHTIHTLVITPGSSGESVNRGYSNQRV
ncbi:unnamed protein product [Adineta ricciae]|uniref:Uncharacterized protein n=1 Tax=Adineta ricciae TaxID=249248 RepID=A0A815IHI6_ADIRI|nr:unnamed protein product [Adineta ricciae]